ncbi:MAG: hypothetical protein AAF581_17520 [Planctomycetota bacterium]
MNEAKEQPNPEQAVLAGRISPEGQVAQGEELPQFVTRLTPIEQQVGVNVIAALQHPETAAVLSSVAMGGDGAQRIVSVGLDLELLQEIQMLLQRAAAKEKPAAPSVKCIGFQCYINNDDDDAPQPGEDKPQPDESKPE